MKTTTEQLLSKRTNSLLSIEKVILSIDKSLPKEQADEQRKVAIDKIMAIVADGLVTEMFFPKKI
jgi:hypothetical protein